jgi:hypothetical protein
VYAQARICVDGTRKVLLINKSVHSASVHISGATAGVMMTIDTESGDNPATISHLTSNIAKLGPFATAIIILP